MVEIDEIDVEEVDNAAFGSEAVEIDEEDIRFLELGQQGCWNQILDQFSPADSDALRVMTDSFKVRDRRLQREEEARLIKRAQAEDQAAKQILVESCFGLVLSEVRKFRHRHNVDSEHPTLSVGDLVQEGLLGLLKAISKWRSDKNARLSTYAMGWIRQGIHRAFVNSGRTIRLPINHSVRLSQILKIHASLQAQLGRPPSHRELAEKLEINEATLFKLLRQLNDVTSLSAPVNDNSEDKLGDFIVGSEISPLRSAYLGELKMIVDRLLSTLPDREQQIIRMRFGLDDGEIQTLENIGEHFHLSRERIRQIENQILHDLRIKHGALVEGEVIQ